MFNLMTEEQLAKQLRGGVASIRKWRLVSYHPSLILRTP